MTVVTASMRLSWPEPRSPRLPRLLAELALGRPANLNNHERSFGPLPLPLAGGSGGSPSPWASTGERRVDRQAARRAAARLIDTVERAGLTGRGGAAFPTARKLRSVAGGPRLPVVVANGAEGEPASHKDRLLLSRAPHLVLDGIELAAFAVGADQAYLAVHAADTRLIAFLETALQAREVAMIDPVPIELVEIDTRYVASEQTAIVQRINGGAGLPTFSPPRPHERGVAGRPTAVNNVETLAHLALIARYGDTWFRSAGGPGAPGTALVTISGQVRRPGVYEIELGTPIGEVLTLAGPPVERPQAILTGGYFGTWLPTARASRVPLSSPSLRRIGAAMGAGVLVVLGESSCGLAETARVVRFLAQESAGQCGPCVFGLPALADAMADLAYQGGRGDEVERIASLIPLIEGRGACRHPDGATQLAASALATFARDARDHDRHGPCSRVSRPPMLPIPDEAEY